MGHRAAIAQHRRCRDQQQDQVATLQQEKIAQDERIDGQERKRAQIPCEHTHRATLQETMRMFAKHLLGNGVSVGLVGFDRGAEHRLAVIAKGDQRACSAVAY